VPFFEKDDTKIYYEIHGEGFPILLFAPGGMRSALSFWQSSPWNPIDILSKDFTVIAMDQRNAGQSSAPISQADGWPTYTQDHINLLDSLHIDKCHVMGGCIGGPYCFGLIQAQPERVAAAIIQQTIGLDNNREAFYGMFDSWAAELSGIPQATLNQFRSNMYDGEFLLNVDEGFVAKCSTPLLVLMGDDLYHPQSTSRRIGELAMNAQLIEEWKSPDKIADTVSQCLAFLKANT
jgi:pimeloyl-ACP methyl ester carboxylesterase